MKIRTKTVRLTIDTQGQVATVNLPLGLTDAVIGIMACDHPVAAPITVDAWYYGVGPAGLSDVATLTRQLNGQRRGHFAVEAPTGAHVFFAWPVRFGLPQLSINGVAGGFAPPTVLPVTDAYTNDTENYYLWQSQQDGLGAVEVAVG